MGKLTIINVGMLSCAIGFAAGAAVINHYSKRIERHMTLWGAEDKADLAVRALKLVRKGDTNTIGFLESNLDTAITEMGATLEEKPDSQWTGSDFEMLEIARRYRKDYPRKFGSEMMGKEVDRSFSLLDRKK